jgi:hypothetical protein
MPLVRRLSIVRTTPMESFIMAAPSPSFAHGCMSMTRMGRHGLDARALEKLLYHECGRALSV